MFITVLFLSVLAYLVVVQRWAIIATSRAFVIDAYRAEFI
jgi:hypothetical protein